MGNGKLVMIMVVTALFLISAMPQNAFASDKAVYVDSATGTTITLEMHGLNQIKITYEKGKCKETHTINIPQGTKSKILKMKCNGVEVQLRFSSGVWKPYIKQPGWKNWRGMWPIKEKDGAVTDSFEHI